MYLCKGGSHPMARLLDLLRKGRSIARQEGVRANVEWSHGDQVLKLTGVQAFSTVQFQAMVAAAI